MKKKVLVALIFIVLVQFISASFLIGNVSHSINKEYPPSGDIAGWINISLKSEPSDYLFTDSFDNSMVLIDLIKKNPAFNYNCSTKGCLTDYSVENSNSEKTFLLAENVSKNLGFLFTGNIREINSVGFSIASNVEASCKNQLKIDFLGDDEFEVGNDKVSSQICTEKNYSCFEISSAKEEYNIGTTPYCQKIRLGEGPGFNVGAWVKKVNENSPELLMWLYDGNTRVGTCSLPEPTAEGGEINCTIDYLIMKPKDYYLCIWSALGGAYRTRGNINPSVKCGFHSLPPGTGETAYQLFSQQMGFDTTGTIEIADTLPNESSISSMMENYIISKYGSLNCVDKECIVPLKIKSEKDQTILINGLEIIYEKSGEVTINEFYDLQETAPRISSNFQKLYLDEGNFSVPSEYGNVTFELNLNNQEILSEKIMISKMPSIKSLSPLSTALGYSTLFKAEIEKSGLNITKYDWDFDGETKTSSKNEISYAYRSLGIHSLTVSITDSKNNKISKKFQIDVYSPKEKIEQDIERMNASLANIKKEIGKFPTFDQDSLKSILNLNDTENSLAEIKQEYSTASTEDEYLSVLDNLFSIDLPDSISVSESFDSILFLPQKENINLETLTQITGEDYNASDEQGYLDAINSWGFQNLEIKISSKQISSLKDGVESPLLKIFGLHTKEKAEIIPDTYLIIKQIGGLKFEENFDETEGGYFYKKLNKGDNTITFSTTDNIEFTDLPIFISPHISELHVQQIPPEVEKEKPKWGIIILSIFILLIIAYIIYIILQQWYKYKYENHLFKNRNNLFNLVNYINNERKMGVEDKEISLSLKKAKWDSEQIDYAMKKYAGKRTGMFELPFLRIFRKKKTIQGIPPVQRGMPPQGVGRGYFPERRPPF